MSQMPLDNPDEIPKVNHGNRAQLITLNPPIKKKSERKLLKAEPCKQCMGFFSNPAEVHKYCRHRYEVPRPKTPPGFWEVGWISPTSPKAKKLKTGHTPEVEENMSVEMKEEDRAASSKPLANRKPGSSVLALLSPTNPYYSPIKSRRDVRPIKLVLEEDK